MMKRNFQTNEELLIERYQYLIHNNMFSNPYYKTKEEEKIDIELKIEELKQITK